MRYLAHTLAHNHISPCQNRSTCSLPTHYLALASLARLHRCMLGCSCGSSERNHEESLGQCTNAEYYIYYLPPLWLLIETTSSLIRHKLWLLPCFKPITLSVNQKEIPFSYRYKRTNYYFIQKKLRSFVGLVDVPNFF